MIAFGPVPSRRLGRSLGINNIPAKHCTYSCLYCQAGRTPEPEVCRRVFLDPGEVVGAVTQKVEAFRAAGHGIDYLTFVPDGEPTLDANLGAEIAALKPLGIRIAVISNGTLLGLPDVRADLAGADLVSVKVDAVRETTRRAVNRPHPALDLGATLRGIMDFAARYGGELITETMLVRGINDGPEDVEAVAAFLERLAPRRAWLTVPVRPPAEPMARPPGEAALVRAHEIVRRHLPEVGLLTAGEEGPFGRTGDPAEDLLAILAVHPMRVASVGRYLEEAGADWDLVHRLVREERAVMVAYRGVLFLARRGESLAA
jgi:wyosine [tRNA(Phe)-imidazoG37] synthetase (radical SAM superfamily)